MLVLFYGLLQSTCYQCELEYLAIFICLHECWSYSTGFFNIPAINVNSNILQSLFVCLNAGPIILGSFNRPAVNVNLNIFPSSFVCLNAGLITWVLSIGLLSMSMQISWHLHLFALILFLFCGLFQWTSYQCELQYLPIFICFLECWSYSMGSLNRPPTNVNSNSLESSFVCLNAGPVLWAPSIELLPV